MPVHRPTLSELVAIARESLATIREQCTPECRFELRLAMHALEIVAREIEQAHAARAAEHATLSSLLALPNGASDPEIEPPEERQKTPRERIVDRSVLALLASSGVSLAVQSSATRRESCTTRCDESTDVDELPRKLDALNRALCERLEQGLLPPDNPEFLASMRANVRARLAIDNPRFESTTQDD